MKGLCLMKDLHDRINRVINTAAFEQCLEAHDVDLIKFQYEWHRISGGVFEKLPEVYQQAILAGERELEEATEIVLC